MTDCHTPPTSGPHAAHRPPSTWRSQGQPPGDDEPRFPSVFFKIKARLLGLRLKTLDSLSDICLSIYLVFCVFRPFRSEQVGSPAGPPHTVGMSITEASLADIPYTHFILFVRRDRTPDNFF